MSYLDYNGAKITFNNEFIVDPYVDTDIYTTVTIGTQTWMVENFKATRFRDGTPIPNVSTNSEWAGNKSRTPLGAYCWYDNNIEYKDTYGAIYNYHAAASPAILPFPGFHLPSRNEYITLANYLGGAADAGAALKEAGLTHWLTPNASANNSSGFTGLPGGYRGNVSGTYYNMGVEAHFWTTTFLPATPWPYYVALSNTTGEIYINSYDYMSGGASVRLIKN
jgi:uncharacterized protein (TIGR02145 family)